MVLFRDPFLLSDDDILKNESEIYPYSVTDMSDKDAIVLAPHPDDESIGCGGSIAKHVKNKSRLKVIFLTDGGKGDFEGRFGSGYVMLRKESAEKAMEVLGVDDYEFWGYEDRKLHLSNNEVIERLYDAIKDFAPSIIYAPSPYEIHPDHKALSKMIMSLHRDIGSIVLLYEVGVALLPEVLVDITSEMEEKRKAIECYMTELHYNDYLSKIEGLNRFRTVTLPNSVTFAEGFILLSRGKLS